MGAAAASPADVSAGPEEGDDHIRVAAVRSHPQGRPAQRVARVHIQHLSPPRSSPLCVREWAMTSLDSRSGASYRISPTHQTHACGWPRLTFMVSSILTTGVLPE